MRISSNCNVPTESDSQLGCINLIFIVCAITSTALALIAIGLLAWRQSTKDDRAHQSTARQQDIDLEERAFSANAVARTDSIASRVSGAPPSYHSRKEDDVIFDSEGAAAPAYEERARRFEGRETSGGQVAGGPDVGSSGKHALPENWRDSMDLSIEHPPVENGLFKTR